MSVMTINSPEELWASVARDAEFGEEQAAAAARVLADPRFGPCLLFVADGEGAEVPAPLRALYGVLSRQRPLGALGESLRPALEAALSRLPLRRVLPQERAARAPDNAPGVVRAGSAMGLVAERFAGLVVLPFHLGEFQGLVGVIALGQGVHAALSRLSRRAQENLGVWETRLVHILREYGAYLEALVAADAEQVEELEPLRRYFSGPAQQGVQTRKDNAKDLERLTQRAQVEGQEEARSSAWGSMLEEFRGFVAAQARRAGSADVPAEPGRRGAPR